MNSNNNIDHFQSLEDVDGGGTLSDADNNDPSQAIAALKAQMYEDDDEDDLEGEDNFEDLEA